MEMRRRLFEHVACWGVFLMIMVSPLLFALPVARAEGQKSLEEVLVEKGVLSQEEAAAIQGRKFAKWIDRLSFSGDLRLRHESAIKDGIPAVDRDRHRERFRLRVGSELKMGDFLVGIRLASGEGQQFSTNQSFDNLFSQKPLFIDRAYLQWRSAQGLTLTGGKMAIPFFTLYTSDIVWDEDISPEGFAESFQMKLSDSLTLFANAGQFVLDEDGTDNNDQWLFGEQGGVQVGLGKAAQFTLAGAFYNFKNATESNFGQVAGGVEPGNTRVTICTGTPPGPPGCLATTDTANNTNRLANPFRVLDITAELALNIGGLPVAIQGDYIKNLADTTTDKDTGYQVGTRIGRANDPQTWEVAYYYKYSETDATVADLADADFGDGGTNRKGHIVWVAYQFTKAIQFKTKYFNTKVEDESLPSRANSILAGKNDIQKLQVDLVTKF